jgi:thiamine-monophosphate kinase
MHLKEVGEFGLIDLIKDDTIVDPASVVMGIGDDAAVYRPGPGMLELLTTDMLVENVHFRTSTTSPWQLGYKAVAVNLSDIAAMGGQPRQAVVSLGLPPGVAVEYVIDLYKGMKEICREFGVNIVGGDTVSSPHGLVVNVAVVGEVAPAGLLRRSGARPGDVVAVTGTLGDSAAGLDLLATADWQLYDYAWPLVTAHLTPRPRLDIGRQLAGWGASAADDISDGLASEANEIARASQVGVRLFADKVPISPAARQAAVAAGRRPLDYALFGGEDFQLVFTLSKEAWAGIPGGAGRLTAVGEVTDRAGEVVLVDAGRSSRLDPKGYNHFR